MPGSQKECIVILGMHRSGTSVLTGLLNLLGGDVGSDLMEPTQDNPKGYFENNHIYHLNRKILQDNGADWDTVDFDISSISESDIKKYVSEAEKVIESEFKYVKQIVIKDPRVCYLFPIWEQALKQCRVDIKVILAVRSPLEVARSISTRNHFSKEKSIQLWASHILHAEKFSRGYKRLYVLFPQDYRSPGVLISSLINALDLKPSDENVALAREFYSPSLAHHRLGFENISGLPSSLMALVQLIKDGSYDENAFDLVSYQVKSDRAFYAAPILESSKRLEERSALEVENLTKLMSSLEVDVQVLQDKLQVANSENEEIGLEYELLNQKCLKLDADIKNLEGNEVALKSSKNEVSELQERITSLRAARRKEKRKLKNLRLSESALKKEVKNLLKQSHSYKSLQIQFKDNEQELTAKNKFIDRLKLDVKKLLDKISIIEGDYHRLRDDRNKKNAQIKSFSTALSSEETRLVNSEGLIRSLAENSKLSKKLISYLNEDKLSLAYKKKWYWPFDNKPLATQRKRTIADSGLFNPIYYLTSYPDVRKSGMNPLEHFYRYGWKEGRRPSKEFDLKAYLIRNPDVERSGMNPLLHYLLHGRMEGRSPTPTILNKVEVKTETKPSTSVSPTIVSSQVENSSSPKQVMGPIIPRNWPQKIKIISRLDSLGQDLTKPVNEDSVAAAQSELEAYGKLPLVSIIMPCWNRGDVIKESIDSALKQSYNNLELIISDDGSTDGTIEFIRANYAEMVATGKVKLVQNEHKGVCATRNAALKAATGDLIGYLDSDNQWRKHYLLFMVTAFLSSDELYCAYSALLSHDNNKKTKRILSTKFDRKQLLNSNFIDLNVFMHRASLYKQYGGFDESLTRLVDWELIIRYTKLHEPAYLPFIGVDYYLDHDKFNNITTSVGLDNNRNSVYRKHFSDRMRHGLEKIKLAYVLWDFPALSQTFVINELRWLVKNKVDVKVYYAVNPDKAATLDFNIDAYEVKSAVDLIPLLVEHDRNYCHSHFAYPAVTKLTWPACHELKMPFTFMPHAVDIFHHENQKRNNIGKIAQSSLCQKVFVHGNYHKTFLENCGVPSEKMAFNFQAVTLDDFLGSAGTSENNFHDAKSNAKAIFKGVLLSRFVEKKGVAILLDAASMLKNEGVCFELYGYGPLEADYREQIEEKQLKNVRLMGGVDSKSDVRELYQNCDFLIAPCVEAENGDRDGFPTVILEAFSMGVPVITTDIAAIPDYLTDGVQALIAPASNPKALVAKIKELKLMPKIQREALVREARYFLKTKIGTDLSMSMLNDVWLNKRIDIFLVSFNNEQYDDEAETLEILDRLIRFTTTPFNLTIIDNNSEEQFWNNIQQKVQGLDNIRLIRKSKNLMCGPSSNIALEMSDSEFAIYICAKEGFVAQHGWERTLINAMNENPTAALGGHHAHMPKYVYGREYEQHPDFNKFRNKDYIIGRSDKPFTHIQGGIFIIRRAVFAEHGGFNPLIPHGGMDVELSYYYESLGYKLLEIPEVASLTVKTRPTLSAIVDESTVVAHPLTVNSVERELDNLVAKKVKQCNVCHWQGKLFNKNSGCPNCQSTPEERLIYQFISTNHRIYRNSKALLLGAGTELKAAVKPLFNLSTAPNLSHYSGDIIGIKCIIVADSSLSMTQSVLAKLYEMLEEGGLLIVVDNENIDHTSLSVPNSRYTRRSSVVEYTWKSLVLFEKQ